MIKQEIIGYIGNDAEIREATSGNTVINFNVAHSENWKDKDGNKQSKTIWVRCSYWINKTTIAQYLKKGTQVYVTGTPNASAYQNQQGEIIVQEGINVRHLELLGGAKNQQQTNGNTNENSNKTPLDDVPVNEDETDDLPF